MPNDDIQATVPGAILDLGASLDAGRGFRGRRVGTPSANEGISFEDKALELAMADATARKLVGLHEKGQDDDERRLRLRVMAILAHRFLCQTPSHGHVEMSELAMLAMDPRKPSGDTLVATRHGIGKMAASGFLKTIPSGPYSWMVGIIPDGKFVVWIAGGERNLGILTPKRLAAARQGEVEECVAESGVFPPQPLSARRIRDRIAERVVGLESGQRDVVAGRLALHMARARLIATGVGTDTPNECVLVLGESGTGKTWVCEQAGRATGLPQACVSAAELTASGYVGMSADEALRGLVMAAKGRVEAARYGIMCYDEMLKRGSSVTDSPVNSTCVQNELLRIVQGQPTQVGGKRSNSYEASYLLDTRGTFFFLCGHAPGLDRLIERRMGRKAVGFGSGGTPKAGRAALLDALEDFGLIPELINRLTAVVALPPPRLADLINAATRANGVIAGYNKVLADRQCLLRLDDDAVREIAQHCLRTRLYYRGMSAVVSALAAEAVTRREGKNFDVKTADVRRIVGGLDEAADDLLAHKLAAKAGDGDRVMDEPGRPATSTG